MTPEQIARGEQLARTLDELDRQMAEAAALASSEAEGNEPQQIAAAESAQLDSLAQAAQAQQATMSAARAQAQQEAAMALNIGSPESTGVPAATGAPEAFEIRTVDRGEGSKWGRLRSKSAEDTASRHLNASALLRYRPNTGLGLRLFPS